MYSTLLNSDTRLGEEPPISSAKRASFRRFAFVSRTRRSMSCVVTGAPFSMLAELPMTTASSLATRSALARATRVRSARSEDVSAVLPPGDEDRAPLVWQEQAAHDQAQITGVDPGDLRGELPADILHLPREALRIARPSPAGPVAPGRGALFQAATAPAFTTHFRCVHPASITQALGFLHSG